MTIESVTAEFVNFKIIIASVFALSSLLLPYLFTPFKELFYGYEKIFRGIAVIFSISAILCFQLYIVPEAPFLLSDTYFFFIVLIGIFSIIPVFLLSISENILKTKYKVALTLLLYLYFCVSFVIAILNFAYIYLPGHIKLTGKISEACGKIDSMKVGLYRPDYVTRELTRIIEPKMPRNSEYTIIISVDHIKDGDIVAVSMNDHVFDSTNDLNSVCNLLFEKDNYKYVYKEDLSK